MKELKEQRDNLMNSPSAEPGIRILDREIYALRQFIRYRSERSRLRRQRRNETRAATEAAKKSGGNEFVFVIYTEGSNYMVRQVRVGNLHMMLKKIDERRNWTLDYVCITTTWTVGNEAKKVGRELAEARSEFDRMILKANAAKMKYGDYAFGNFGWNPGWSKAAAKVEKAEILVSEARRKVCAIFDKIDSERRGDPLWEYAVWPPMTDEVD